MSTTRRQSTINEAVRQQSSTLVYTRWRLAVGLPGAPPPKKKRFGFLNGAVRSRWHWQTEPFSFWGDPMSLIDAQCEHPVINTYPQATWHVFPAFCTNNRTVLVFEQNRRPPLKKHTCDELHVSPLVLSAAHMRETVTSHVHSSRQVVFRLDCWGVAATTTATATQLRIVFYTYTFFANRKHSSTATATFLLVVISLSSVRGISIAVGTVLYRAH